MLRGRAAPQSEVIRAIYWRIVYVVRSHTDDERVAHVRQRLGHDDHVPGSDAQPLPDLSCPPELKVSTPAHTKQLGWHVEFESRVTHVPRPAMVSHLTNCCAAWIVDRYIHSAVQL